MIQIITSFYQLSVTFYFYKVNSRLNAKTPKSQKKMFLLFSPVVSIFTGLTCCLHLNLFHLLSPSLPVSPVVSILTGLTCGVPPQEDPPRSRLCPLHLSDSQPWLCPAGRGRDGGWRHHRPIGLWKEMTGSSC